MGSGRSVSACLSLVTWALVSQETHVFGTNGRDFSFSSARLQKKTVTWRFSQIFWRYRQCDLSQFSSSCLTHKSASEFATMIKRERVLFKIAWVLLAITGVAILVFGLIATAWPASSERSSLQAIGVASIGMGLFGVMITVIAYRRRERWAWFT